MKTLKIRHHSNGVYNNELLHTPINHHVQVEGISFRYLKTKLKTRLSSEYFNVQTILQPYVHMCFVVFSEIKSIFKTMHFFPMSISYAQMG